MSFRNEQTCPSNEPRDINMSLGRMIDEGFPDEESLFPEEYVKYRSTDSRDPEIQDTGNVGADTPEAVGPSMSPTGHLSLGKAIAQAFPDDDSMFPEEYAKYDKVDNNVPKSETESSKQEPPKLQSASLEKASAEDASQGRKTVEAFPGEQSISSEDSSDDGNIHIKAPKSKLPKPVEILEHPITFRSLDQMISEAFPDQDSIYCEKNQSPEQVAFESEESDSQQSVDVNNVALDNWPHRNIHEDLSIQDAIHPWGLIDYHLLNRLVEETPVQKSMKPGVMVFNGTEFMSFVSYDAIVSRSRRGYGRHPRFIFGLIPLPEESSYFMGKTLVMYWDCKTKEIVAREFRQIPRSIYDIWSVWNDGVDIYVFKTDDLGDMLVQSADSDDGAMVIPSIGGFPWCLDNERQDHPGLQLVILSQAATFMVHMASVVSSDPDTRSKIIDAVKKWRHVLLLSSEAMWTDVQSGCSKAEFVEKMMTNKAVTEALGLTHGKTHEKSWVPPMPEALQREILEWSDASKLRQKRLEDEAISRAQKRFDGVFEQQSAVFYPRKVRMRIPVSQRFNLHQVANEPAPESTASSVSAKEDDHISSASPLSSSPESHEVQATVIHRTLKAPSSRLPIPGRGRQDSIDQKAHSPGTGYSVTVKEDEENPHVTPVSSSADSQGIPVGAKYSSLKIPRTRPRQVPSRSRQNSIRQRTHSPESDTAIESEGLPQDEETEVATESGTNIDKDTETTGSEHTPDGNTAREEKANNEQAEGHESDLPSNISMTSLASLVNCLQDFVRRHPEVDNVHTRHHFRVMLAYTGIVLREAGDQPPQVVKYLLNDGFHTSRE